MSETKKEPGEEAREKFLKRAQDLANLKGVSLNAARKMINSSAAHHMFENDPKLLEWEKDNFPDPNNIDPNDQ